MDESQLLSAAAGSNADGRSSSRLAPLIIVGDGGHGRVVADNVRALESFRIIAVADDRFTNIACRDGVFHVHPGMVRELVEADHNTKVLIAIGDNRIRSSMVQRLGLPPERYASIVHPAACVSKHAYIGPGSVVMAGAVVNHGACIGAHVIINSGAVVEHDAEVGWFAHISPNSTLAGNVAAGEGAHIGIGASVIPSVRIGAWCVVGAGAAVIRDLPAGATAVGVPAKVIKQRDIIP
ncbi:acetyltransferase [Paenibacillus oenotherae]|uniref:Acetyltransferase n=2 Tax=Paenibacillus oenotherae TaxID=1435645 RepID=A0ABS7D2V7_9BACL|nr:acetyltransferase [Paenibacillus oenotherae]